MASSSKRRDSDIMKLMMSGHEVCMGDDSSASDFYVKLRGPKDSHYEGGHYKVHVTLPATYPYKSPSIGFCTPIFHPNVDEASGSVCLDVINQTWSPMFDLVNIFAVFLPQLLLYPNPADPLNRLAAQLMIKDPKIYQQRVQDHVRQHASKDFTMSADDDDEAEEEEDESEEGHSGDGEEGEGDEMEDADDTMDGDEDDEVLSDCDDLPGDNPVDQVEV